MNDPRPDPDLAALFDLARRQSPDTSRAEYAFETRLVARLREEGRPHASSVWAAVSWRMLPLFACAVLALGLWRSEVVTEAEDAVGLAGANQPEAVDLLSSFD